MFSTNWHRLLTNNHWCRSMLVLEESMSRPCCGDGKVTVPTEEGSSAKINLLMVRGKPLGFDLLLGIDTIKALRGMVFGPTGSVQLGNKEIVKCAAIFINELNFTATFNHWSQVLTMVWKWSGGRIPGAPEAEYPVVAEIREDYEWELRTWMSNGWLVPNKGEELGPPLQGLIPLMAIL